MGQLLHVQSHAIERQDQARRSSEATAIASSGRAAREAARDQGYAEGAKGTAQHHVAPMGEAAIVELRVQARLPLDDVIPHLTRSSLHRGLQRHGVSRLPKTDCEKPKKFKTPCEAIARCAACC